MVVTLTNSLETTPLENKAITVIERVKLKAEIKKVAGEILTILGKISLNKKHKKLNK